MCLYKVERFGRAVVFLHALLKCIAREGSWTRCEERQSLRGVGVGALKFLVLVLRNGLFMRK